MPLQPGRARSPVAVGLIAIGALAACFAVGVPVLQRAVRARIESITESALASVRAIDRMRLDLYREELILQAHVHSTDASEMAWLAREQLAAVEDDFAATARSYGPLATFPGVAAQWERFQRAVAEYQGGFSELLTLSTLNKDKEAQSRLDVLSGRLSEADAIGERLSQLDASAARGTESEVRRTLLWTNTGVVVLALVVLALCLAIGARMLRAQSQVDRSHRDQVTSKDRSAG